MDIRDKIIASVKNLPTLPTIYAALTDAINQKLASSQSIAEVLASDQVSVFKILKVANSPFFGFRGKIDTMNQAIMYLGFNEIKNIVFSLTVINFFSNKKLLEKFRPADFWAHSIAVGIIARKIGQAVGESKLDNYFISGILHDIGKLILLETVSEEYQKVLDTCEIEGVAICEAEKKVIGIDHAEAGRLIAEKWMLPKTLQNVISDHHTLLDLTSSANKLIPAVHIADVTARALNLGFAGDELIPEPVEKVWEVLGLSAGFFNSSIESIH